MKTFDEILIETHSDISRGEMMGKESKLSFRDIERLAAKEYAKQWVKRALEEASEVDVTLLVELEKEIDKQ